MDKGNLADGQCRSALRSTTGQSWRSPYMGLPTKNRWLIQDADSRILPYMRLPKAMVRSANQGAQR